MKLPEAPATAIARLEQAGFETWAVGGCVRDSLRGVCPHDYDLCTAATPEEMQRVFDGERVLETGRQHGTLTWLSPQGPLEITTFRTDGSYSDARHPDRVQFVRSIREDLARRDYTVNAMAFHPKRGVLDPFGGQEDLAARVLRTVGAPEKRFAEDALRILRGVRFSSQLGFAVEQQTARAMETSRALLEQIAAERVQIELRGILCGSFAARALRRHRTILAQVLPEIRPMFDLPQQNPHHAFDVWEHTLRALEQAPADPVLCMAVLLHDSGKPACKTVDENGVGHFRGHAVVSEQYAAAITARLRFDHESAEQIVQLVRHHDTPLGDSPRMLRRRLSQMGEPMVRLLLKMKKCDAVGQATDPQRIGTLLETEQMLGAVCRENACLSIADLCVDGNDMAALGLHGPEIGRMLRLLLDAVVDVPETNEREQLLCLARQKTEEVRSLS